jgi:hypothetical protein
MVLAGIVFLLLLLLAGGGGLVMWQWQRANQARMTAERMALEAREMEYQARIQAERAQWEMAQALDQIRLADPEQPLMHESARAGGLVAGSAAGPLNVLPLLPVGP